MMADTPLCGPYGERLLPQVVEAIAETDPSRVWASIPISLDVTDGFRDITFKEMLHAIDFICWWIEYQIGSSRDFETVAYLGPSDMRYSVMLVATMKCRYQVCPLGCLISLTRFLITTSAALSFWAEFCIRKSLPSRRNEMQDVLSL
jgi:hypothetical protein